MAEMKRTNPILRRERFKVASTRQDEFGNLIAKSELGNEYKISKKREHLFTLFQIGAEIVVGYAKYMDKEYIAEATSSCQLIAADTPIQAEKLPDVKKQSAHDNSAYARALSYAKDLVCAGKIEIADIYWRAEQFAGFIMAGVTAKPSPDATKSKSGGIEPPSSGNIPIEEEPPDLVEEAVKEGAKVIPSWDDVKAKFGKPKDDRAKKTQITDWFNMMISVQSNVKSAKSMKEAFEMLTDDNKIEFYSKLK